MQGIAGIRGRRQARSRRRQTRVGDRRTGSQLVRRTRAARVHLGVTAVVGVVVAILVVAQAAFLGSALARAAHDGASLHVVAPALIALALVALGRGLAMGALEATGRLGASRAMSELRGALVRHVLLDRPGGLQRERSGELATAAVQGVDSLEAYFARYLPQAILSALVPVAVLAWAVTLDWEAAAILAVTVPVLIAFMILVGLGARSVAKRRWRVLGRLGAHFLDVVEGLATLRVHGRAEAQANTIAVASDRLRRETMATLRVAFLSAFVLELVAMLGTALVAATIGVQLVDGSLQLQAGLTVLLLAPELYLPLRQVGAQFHASADGLAAAERIFETLDHPAATPRPEHPRSAPDPSVSAVRLEGVGFAHGGRPEPALDGVDLELAPGEMVALVGPSGAGKSTLASLVLRLADPGEGRVTCGGVDLRDVDARAWRARTAWVPQRPTLFTGTVADNVRLAAPRAGEAEVTEALEAAGGLGFVEGLPQGVHTRLGEGGRRLSAGQTQRIALARAFLADPHLLVLDEPTANLDPESADAVGESIARLAAGRTTLLVVHRPELAARADRIVALEGGRTHTPEPASPVLVGGWA